MNLCLSNPCDFSVMSAQVLLVLTLGLWTLDLGLTILLNKSILMSPSRIFSFWVRRISSATSMDQRYILCPNIFGDIDIILSCVFKEFHELSGSSDKTFRLIQNGFHNLYLEKENIRLKTINDTWSWISKKDLTCKHN